MRYARFPVSDSAALPDFFRTVPAGALDYVKEGFKKLAELDHEARVRTIKIVADQMGEGELGSDDSLRAIASKLQVPANQAAPIISAISLTLSLVPGSDFTAMHFAVEVVRAMNLPAETRQAVLETAQYASANKTTILESTRSQELANEHLPSLTYFGTSVDVRLGFENQKINAAVPVLVVHIDTDSENQSVHFQMTKADAKKLVEDLSKAVERLEAADSVARSITEKGRP